MVISEIGHYLTQEPTTGLIRDLDGSIAQSVEQGIENPCVPGSIPGRATIKFKASAIKPAGAFLLEYASAPYTLTNYTVNTSNLFTCVQSLQTNLILNIKE